jgi:hypothetical protein
LKPPTFHEERLFVLHDACLGRLMLLHQVHGRLPQSILERLSADGGVCGHRLALLMEVLLQSNAIGFLSSMNVSETSVLLPQRHDLQRRMRRAPTRG